MAILARNCPRFAGQERGKHGFPAVFEDRKEKKGQNDEEKREGKNPRRASACFALKKFVQWHQNPEKNPAP